MQCLSFNFNSSAPSFPTSPQSQCQTQTHPDGLNSHPPPYSQGNSTDETPRSSTTQLSPSFNLSHEYTRALQTNSYNEIRSRIEDHVHVENAIDTEGMEDSHQLYLSQVLQPDRESVHHALRHTNPKATLTRLVSTYFDHSEDISTLCLRLYRCISCSRKLYAPITDLLQVFPSELNSINQSQCDWAFDTFLQFDSLENPFPLSDPTTNYPTIFVVVNRMSNVERKISIAAKGGGLIAATTVLCSTYGFEGGFLGKNENFENFLKN